MSHTQHAKKVVSDSLELEDFAIGLASSVVNLLEGQMKSWENWNYKSTVRQIVIVIITYN